MSTSKGSVRAGGRLGGQALLSVLLLGFAASVAATVIYDNGPLVNRTGTGVGGADESVMGNIRPGHSTWGFANGNTAFRVADDFTVTDPSWEIDKITLWAYQNGSGTAASTITEVNYRIWDGPPDDPASNVVFGDITTNRLLASTWSGMYRVFEVDSGVSDERPIMVNTLSCGAVLTAGTYWLDWQSAGSLTSGPWAPPVTIVGEISTGDGMQLTDFWAPALDGDSQEPQALPFILQDQQGGTLHDNGPLLTSPGTGVGGADESIVQTDSLGMSTRGFGHYLRPGDRVADDFTVTDPAGWEIDFITFYAFQDDTGTTSSIIGLNYRIWDGPPGDLASTVVFGDTKTNRLVSTQWANIYRVDEDTAGADTFRPVMANRVSAGVTLPPGDYWLDWQTHGTWRNGPYAPPITITGESITGNGLLDAGSTGTWNPANDAGTSTQQGFPFLLHSGCDAPSISPIGPVKLAWDMSTRDDLLLSWPQEATSTGYNTWWVTDDASGIPGAREGGPWPSLCHQLPATSCRHAGARTATGTVFYYQVRGVCDTEEAPE